MSILKQGLPAFETQMSEFIEHHYGFSVVSYEFIPVGDSAFSYIVENKELARRYLKVFDMGTQKGRLGVGRLPYYLPLMMELSTSDMFPDLPRPYRACTGDLQCRIHPYTCVLFEYVEGETLADAYPFSEDIQRRLAAQLGKLHNVSIPQLAANVDRESYSIDFGTGLHTDLDALTTYQGDNAVIQALQALVLPRRMLIDRFWEQFCRYQEAALQYRGDVVLCHGDVWGGNIMGRPHGNLVFLDWEAAILAPMERDLFSYIGPDYTAFRRVYTEAGPMTRRLNADLIGFFAYRHQLRNLSQWIHNLLHEDLGEQQQQNDLEMIGFHCLDRWPSVAAAVMQLG